MTKINIQVSEIDRDNLQRLDYEYCAKRDIVVYMLNQNSDISMKNFDIFYKQYEQSFISFQLGKQNLEKKYIANDIHPKVSDWNLNYDSCCLTITVKE